MFPSRSLESCVSNTLLLQGKVDRKKAPLTLTRILGVGLSGKGEPLPQKLLEVSLQSLSPLERWRPKLVQDPQQVWWLVFLPGMRHGKGLGKREPQSLART